MRGPFQNQRKKRCKQCKYVWNKGDLIACKKSQLYIESLPYICFKSKKDRK